MELSLPVDAPFHLEATVRLLQRRPRDRVDRWEDGAYLRLWQSEEGLVLSRLRNLGDVDRPDLRLDFPLRQPSAAQARTLADELRRVLGLDVDTGAYERLLAEEPALERWYVGLRGMRPPRFPGLFEAIARTVPFQQLSLDAGVTLLARLVERSGERERFGDREFFAFPAPEAVADLAIDDFRALGFSVAKARCLIESATRIRDGELSGEAIEALSDDEAMVALRKLRGIGPWSASLILLRGFGRLDHFPKGDVGVRRGLSRLLSFEPSSFDAEGYARRFGGLRGMLYFLSLGAQLLDRGWIRPAPPL